MKLHNIQADRVCNRHILASSPGKTLIDRGSGLSTESFLAKIFITQLPRSAFVPQISNHIYENGGGLLLRYDAVIALTNREYLFDDCLVLAGAPTGGA